ncbi:MAG: replicative DNA helicase [Candidatus Alcyoniella australis]|nr:replicative DNA helicase [Candidatus Alcyoniella australis]
MVGRPAAATQPDVFEGKVLPHAQDAEIAVLGGILLDPTALDRVNDIIKPSDFYREAHRQIFESMQALASRGEPIDMLTVADSLKSRDLLERVGGNSYLAALTDQVPTAVNIVHYAGLIASRSVQRGLIRAAQFIQSKSYSAVEDVDQLVNDSEAALFEICDRQIKKSYQSMREVATEAYDHLDTLHSRGSQITGVATGYTDLDNLTAGLQPSELVILASRPSMGKTALALNIAENSALAGTPVALFSLEMSAKSLGVRLLCSHARIDVGRIRKGIVSGRDWSRIALATGVLAEAPIYIDDTPGITVTQIRSKARRIKAEHGLGLVVIDYIQMLKGRDGVNSREQEVSEMSRGLKALAKELDVPVLALSQLNRQVEARDDKRPRLADLRESGAIEQDADVIMFIYRDAYYKRRQAAAEGSDGFGDALPEDNSAEVIVAKQRNGPTDTVFLTFLKHFTRFENQDKSRSDSEFAQ